MRKNFGTKTFLYPQPVLIIASYDENGKPNAMNAAWGGVSDFNQISISLAKHKTTTNILKNKAFTVSIGTSKMLTSCDYVGLVSQNDVPDKFEKSGFTATKSELINAPIINELPLALECEVVEFDEVKEILVCKIVNVSVDESVLVNGEIDSSKLDAIVYDPINHNYVALGDAVGQAFKAGKSLIK